MEQLYFSDEIQRKLSGIYRSGLTMIEAPAGYGKSTAVRWAMKKLPAEQVRWFTAVSFQQDTSLDWFIRQIGSLDASAGNALRELGFLNRSNVSDAADILSRLSISEPCYHPCRAAAGDSPRAGDGLEKPPGPDAAHALRSAGRGQLSP